MTTVALHDITVRHGRRVVVDAVSLSVASGTWTALVGPNGAGKSTLLRALVGLVPYKGEITVDGADVRGLARRALARTVAIVPQQPLIPVDMTVGEYVLLGRTPYVPTLGVESEQDHRVVADVLARLDLVPLAGRRLGQLSGGELQRAVLGRTLAQEAPVLLLDEPTTHLDPPHQVALARLCRHLGRTHTVVTVLHDLPLGLQADRVLVLRAGRVAADAAFDDAALHATLVATFAGAVRIDTRGARPVVMPNLEP